MLFSCNDVYSQNIQDKSMNIQSTKYSTTTNIVLQVLPQQRTGAMTINEVTEKHTDALLFIPYFNNHIPCYLDYFQKCASLPRQWIINENYQLLEFHNNNNPKEVTVTKLENNTEHKIDLPESYGKGLLNYFMLDVSHNYLDNIDFDCYAFISLVSNTGYNKLEPPFDYITENFEPNIGDIVVLTNGQMLPNSILHWAIYLGDDQYISKFGQTGRGGEALVAIMKLEEMKRLYRCSNNYVAKRKKNAPQWSKYIPSTK